jgi:hypothetical protein
VLLPAAAALALVLVLLSALLPVVRYQSVLRAARLAADPAARQAVLPELQALSREYPADVGVVRRTAAVLAAVGRPEEARAVLESGLQTVPASQLLALDLLPYREAARDWAGVNDLLDRLQLRPELIERQLRAAVQSRNWPAVLQWWRRLVQRDSRRAAATMPLAALAAAAERRPLTARLLERSQAQVPGLQLQPLNASGTARIAVTGWHRFDAEALQLAALPYDPVTESVTLNVGNGGARMFQLIDVPQSGRYVLILKGTADPQQAVQLRVFSGEQLIGTTTVAERFWQTEVPLDAPAGPLLLRLEAVAQNGRAWLAFEAATVTAEARP